MKGHKLVRSWSGAQSGYANGRCECGEWVYRGWTDRMGVVIRAHKSHVATVKAANKVTLDSAN